MLYHCLHIEHSFAELWQKDLFDQEICDLGVDTIDGEDYYIPSALWEQNGDPIKAYLSPFNFPFSISEVPDENWNAVWESEHPMQELPLGVKIIPHCAFGAGHHETTSMMIDALINHQIFKSSNHQIIKSSNPQIVNVLDNGCGTGVLGIFAKKLGADYVLAIDIDDKSVQNTLENAALNNVEIDARIGDLCSLPFTGEELCSIERPVDGRRTMLGLGSFYLLLANIHRNILLAQMPTYAQVLEEGGELWMSGFYEEDCHALQQAAEENGLHLIEVRENGVWRMMRCRKEERL